MQVNVLQVIEKLAAVQNIQMLCVSPPYEGLDKFDYGLRKALDPQFDWPDFGRVLHEAVPLNTFVVASGTFELFHAMFRLPDEPDTLCLVGPWTKGENITEKRMRWMERNFSDEALAAIQEYFNGVRNLPDDSGLLSQIVAVLSLTAPGEMVNVEVKQEFLPLNFTPDRRFFEEPEFRDELPIALLEQRYAAERDILDAVCRGDFEATRTAMQQMKRFTYGGRFTGSLYACKNKLTIFNTLMRKSIEQAQVHPYYIDKISARYAQRIENMSMADEKSLTMEMVQEYCDLVQRHSLRSYSPLVQKVINHITFNLNTALSLKSLAAMCYISPSYLSNLFKQETGGTLTDYINTQRINRAAHCLCSSDANIATVAERVGILDVNYFTKMFKKTLGTTPTQYRREHRER